ncbi:MAG: Hpt domain-containing protein, partial [Arenimonas sp.]
LSKPFNTVQIIEKLERWAMHKPAPGPSFAAEKNDTATASETADASDSKLDHGEKTYAERFNEERLEQMAQIKLPGKPNLRDGLLKLYFENAPELISQMKLALSQNDIEALHRTSHSLKSTSANMGLDYLSQLAAKLDDSSRSKRLEDIPQMVDALLCEHEWALEALRAYQTRCIDEVPHIHPT